MVGRETGVGLMTTLELCPTQFRYLEEGNVYTFHMSAAVWRLEGSEYEVTGEFLGWQLLGGLTLLVVKGQESGEIIALNTRHLGIIDKPSEDTEENDGIETDEDGTRTITIDA
jgi:hypothetical protein